MLERQFKELDIHRALDELERQKGLATRSLLQFLGRSPLIGASTMGTIAVGVERYFAGDYVSALHVLVPQFEDALRGLLPYVGVATTSLSRNNATQEMPLQEVLRTPELRSLLGEDLAQYLEIVFVEQQSDNLRNKVAHGLVKCEDCTRDIVQRVLYCLLLLVRFTNGPAPDSAAG